MATQAQAVTISWSILPPANITFPATPSTGNLAIPLASSSTSAPIPATDPPVIVNDPSSSPHYTSLLQSLSSAKDALNARLTDWKDSIGDKEKHKEVGPPGGEGIGKAAMMIRAAKETDGRGVMAVGVGAKVGKKQEGLPTDDQSSDEDEPETVIDG